MKKYFPLFRALMFIALLTIVFDSLYDFRIFSMIGMNMLMGSWFIVFGLSKLFDIPGFVASFKQYDIVTRKIPAYGYVYPFIELFIGISYIFDSMMMYWMPINVATIIISSLTTIGILLSFSHPQKIHCACLGANTELTLGWITLVECGTMVIMALGMIYWML